MSICTTYSNYSDADILRHCHDVRGCSPLIEELCQRLEQKEILEENASEGEEADLDCIVRCPVCEAELEVGQNETSYVLEVS